MIACMWIKQCITGIKRSCMALWSTCAYQENQEQHRQPSDSIEMNTSMIMLPAYYYLQNKSSIDANV